MNIIKVFSIVGLMSCLQFSYAHAEDVVTLSTIHVMADAEMSNEVLMTVKPFQEDTPVRNSLQYQVIKKHSDIQNYPNVDNMATLNIQAPETLPDMANMNPFLRDYVLAVASSLQSTDPVSGIYKMLEPLGVDQRAFQNNRNGPVNINFDQDKLRMLLGDQWRTN